jgi:hypothetical protein
VSRVSTVVAHTLVVITFIAVVLIVITLAWWVLSISVTHTAVTRSVSVSLRSSRTYTIWCERSCCCVCSVAISITTLCCHCGRDRKHESEHKRTHQREHLKNVFHFASSFLSESQLAAASGPRLPAVS